MSVNWFSIITKRSIGIRLIRIDHSSSCDLDVATALTVAVTRVSKEIIKILRNTPNQYAYQLVSKAPFFVIRFSLTALIDLDLKKYG